MEQTGTRIAFAIGALAGTVVWMMYAPMLFIMSRNGEISILSIGLISIAAICLLVAGIRVLSGRGLIPFILHIVFTLLGVLAMHSVAPYTRIEFPLIIGGGVSIAATVLLLRHRSSAAANGSAAD